MCQHEFEDWHPKIFTWRSLAYHHAIIKVLLPTKIGYPLWSLLCILLLFWQGKRVTKVTNAYGTAGADDWFVLCELCDSLLDSMNHPPPPQGEGGWRGILNNIWGGPTYLTSSVYLPLKTWISGIGPKKKQIAKSYLPEGPVSQKSLPLSFRASV